MWKTSIFKFIVHYVKSTNDKYASVWKFLRRRDETLPIAKRPRLLDRNTTSYKERGSEKRPGQDEFSKLANWVLISDPMCHMSTSFWQFSFWFDQHKNVNGSMNSCWIAEQYSSLFWLWNEVKSKWKKSIVRQCQWSSILNQFLILFSLERRLVSFRV